MDHFLPNPYASDQLESLLAATPAKLGVWRAGTRPLTAVWLRFRQEHALAQDAVCSELSEQFLGFAKKNKFPVIQSLAADRQDFVHFPPKGKRASPETVDRLKACCAHGSDVQIVISDGLSARAVEANIPDLLPMLEHGFKQEKISLGTPVVARLARVAIADQIAFELKASCAVNLIGERPGLSCCQGLSAYITYNPGPETISSDRTVVSNIHSLGTPPAEAGAYIVSLVKRILELRVSGVALQRLG